MLASSPISLTSSILTQRSCFPKNNKVPGLQKQYYLRRRNKIQKLLKMDEQDVEATEEEIKSYNKTREHAR